MPKIHQLVTQTIVSKLDYLAINDAASLVAKKIRIEDILEFDFLESVGTNNLIQRDSNNTYTGLYIFIQGEDNQSMTGNHMFIRGKNNVVNGDFVDVSGENHLSGGSYGKIYGKGCGTGDNYSTVGGYGCFTFSVGGEAKGANAVSKNYGERTFANGHFSTNGDAQFGTVLFRGVVSNLTTSEIFLDDNSIRFEMCDKRICSMRIHLTAWLKDDPPNPDAKPSVYQVWDFLGRRIDAASGYVADAINKQTELIMAGISAPVLTVDDSNNDFRFNVQNTDGQGDLRVILKCDVHYIGIDDIVLGGGGGFDDPIGNNPTE